MGDPTLNRATFRSKFELEKRHRSYTDFRPKVNKSQPEIESSSPSNYIKNKKAIEMDEIIRNMNHLPCFLEKGRPIQDRALSFGVMDWGRLEKWQDRNHKGIIGNNQNIKCSPSSSNSSSLFSTDGSSPRSTRGQSCSPARQKVHRVTLQSHFKQSPNGDFTPEIESCNLENVENLRYVNDPQTPPSSCSKLKLKIQNESINDPQNVRNNLDKHQNSQMITNSDPKTSNVSVNKSRSISPLRRFSFSLNTSSKSVTEKPESPSSRHSSPLRRLLDPIFASKSRQFPETFHEDPKPKSKAKTKLDFQNSNGIKIDDSRKQAIFQTTVKNNRLLFTFAVENDKDILAATVTNLTEKDENKNRVYTFFTVQELKKKNISWLPNSNKTKDHGYVPNVTAQMKVLSLLNSHLETREFVLFSVDSNVQPQEELEAIVVKFPKKLNCGDNNNEDGFSATVVLPGGSHGVPSKGGPSPLIYRWRSGGVCDCGGWDEGCRLKVLGNHVRCSGSKSEKVHTISSKFELFVQGEVENKKPIFGLSSLKEGIFSIEYNSSLSALQAFSICISIVECRKVSRNAELRTHARQEAPIVYTPIPGIKRNTTSKVTSL